MEQLLKLVQSLLTAVLVGLIIVQHKLDLRCPVSLALSHGLLFGPWHDTPGCSSLALRARAICMDTPLPLAFGHARASRLRATLCFLLCLDYVLPHLLGDLFFLLIFVRASLQVKERESAELEGGRSGGW